MTSRLLTQPRRCEAQAVLNALPYPQRGEAEVDLLLGLTIRRARELAADLSAPAATRDRMDDLAERLAELTNG